jgi:alanine racemase
MTDSPCRLSLDGDALVSNWRALERLSGAAACGAAVKADGYGLGARAVVDRLAAAGCRDFFVATWAEAAALGQPAGTISVLHGIRPADIAHVGLPGVRPVLNTPAQVARWKAADGGACDVMVDTGMNRLGVSTDDIAAGLLDDLEIETLMSHLACADDDVAMNARQCDLFAGLAGRTNARRLSLANSAGIVLGPDYAFDLTRPGLALYGGVPRDELAGSIGQVVTPEAQILQRRRVLAGESVGYNSLWTATSDTDVAILNIGYADGYFRGFSNRGFALVDDRNLPVLGRVSMDLIAVDVTDTDAREGDWIALQYELRAAAEISDMSQYELLTGLGPRLDRVWR